MQIYAYKIQGGGINGNDINEINNLNHYIGMKKIEQADFREMEIMPFMFGVFILLALRAVVFGEMKKVIDLFVVASYFGAFSIGSFYYRLYWYGHNLDPHAPVHIRAVHSAGLRHAKNRQLHAVELSGAGHLSALAFMVLLLLAIWFSRKEKVLGIYCKISG